MMTDERMRELRSRVWALARGVLSHAANTRAAMPFLVDEEYEYARAFMLGIASRTRPGEYREPEESEESEDDQATEVVVDDPLNHAIDQMIGADQALPADDYLLAKIRSMCSKVSAEDLRIAIGVHRENCRQPRCPVLAAMEHVASEWSTEKERSP